MSPATAQATREAIAHEQKRAAERKDMAWRACFESLKDWGFDPWRLYAAITDRLEFWRRECA